MTEGIQRELIALTERWRARAKTFMSEAEQARRGEDMVRLTAMASTLEWAASDLSFFLDGHRRSESPLPPAAAREDQAPES